MSKTPFRMPQRAELPRAELDHWVTGGERPAASPEGASATNGQVAKWRG